MKTLLLVLVMMINAKVNGQTQEQQRPGNGGGGGSVQPLCNSTGTGPTVVAYYVSDINIATPIVCRTSTNQTVDVTITYTKSPFCVSQSIYEDLYVFNYNISTSSPSGTSGSVSGGSVTSTTIIYNTSTNPNTYTITRTLNLTNIPVNQERRIFVTISAIGRTDTYTTETLVLPKAPTITSLIIEESCIDPTNNTPTNTGAITISGITIYKEARLWLTGSMIQIGPSSSVNPCPELGSYPSCYNSPGNTVILGSHQLVSPNGVYPYTIPQSYTIQGLNLNTDYYLTIINKDVSEPLACGIRNKVVRVDSYALLGDYPHPTVNAPIPASYPTVVLNTPTIDYASIDTRSVVVNSNFELFVSDFKGICCPNATISAELGVIKIKGKGGSSLIGSLMQLKVERATMTSSFSIYLNTSITAVATYPAPVFIPDAQALPENRPITPAPPAPSAGYYYYGPPTTTWSGEINDLPEGIYRLTVTDACGQSIVNTVVIKKPIAIEAVNTIPVSVTQPICSTDAGSATLSIKAEQKPENFSEENINIQWRVYKIISGIETPISVDYRLNNGTIANGQTGTTPISTTIGSTLDFSMSNLQPGNYVVYMDREQYVWASPSVLQCNLAGSFPCTGTPFPFTINAVAPLSVPTTGTNAPLATLITCPTGTTGTAPDANSNGIITMTATGTTVGGLYIYELLKEIGTTYTFVTTQTSISANFTGLSAGNYKIVTKRNVAGCASDDITSSVIVVSEPPALTTTISTQNISCYGASGDGTISVTVAGGTPFLAPANTYTVVLNRITNYPTTPYVLLPVSTPPNMPIVANVYTFSTLGEGYYQVEVRDSKPCSLPISSVISVVEPSQLTVSGLTINNIICSTDIATIVPTVAVGTGTAPYRFFYQIGTATPVEYVATDAFTADTYTISVKDNRGCVAIFASGVSNTVTINSATTPIVAPITLSSFSGGYQISCLNGNNGVITITSASGGNGVGFTNTYQYKINKTAPIVVNGTYQNSTVAGSNVFASLTKGTYDIYVKDSRGCEKIQTFTLTEPSIAIGYSVSIIQNVICANEATGRITVTPTGGSGIGYQVAIRKQDLTTTTPQQLTYVPVTGATYTFGALPGTGLRADIYDIYVQDSNGCTSQAQPQTVGSAYPLITVATVQNNISCLGAAPDGSLTITPTAGTAPFIYRWIGSSNTTNTRTGLVAGIYQLEITDANNCTEPFTFTITQPALVLSATATTDVACYQQTNGKITIVPVGGTPPYQYSKDNGATWQIPISNIYVFSNLAPQVYNLKLKDSKNCIVALSKTVTERGDTPKIAYLVSTRQNAEDEIVLVNVSVPEPTSTIWEFDANTTVISQANDKAIVRYNAPGSFPVKMIASFTDCVYTSTKNISISPLDTPIPGVTPGTRPIASAVVTPNPSDGNFNLALTLNKRQYVHLILVDAMGNIRYEDKNTTTRFLSVNKNIAVDIPSGVYNLRIITDDDAKDIRITVVR